MYENLLGRKADQGGLDYWAGESRSGRQSMDQIRQNILRSDEFKGRSEADRQAAIRGVEQRKFQRERRRRGKPPRQRHFGTSGPKTSRPNRRGSGKFNLTIHHRDGGFRGKGKARPTGRGSFPA